MDAVAAVVPDIDQPGCAELTLYVQAPLLRVRRLVIDRHAGLDGERRCRGNRSGRPRWIGECAAVDVEIGQEALA